MRNKIFGIALIALVIGCLSFIDKDTFTVQLDSRNGDTGIVFDSLSLEDALKKSKETGKLIFIDVYTSWCGPCKMMSRGPFKDEKVGEVFNKSFINLKIDAEKDPDGEFVSRAYSVRAYPTMIFIDGNGKLVKTIIGYQTAEALIGYAEMRK